MTFLQAEPIVRSVSFVRFGLCFVIRPIQAHGNCAIKYMYCDQSCKHSLFQMRFHSSGTFSMIILRGWQYFRQCRAAHGNGRGSGLPYPLLYWQPDWGWQTSLLGRNTTQAHGIGITNILVFMPYPTGNKFSSEVKFGYLAYVKFVKFGTLLDFQNFFNNCLYNSQS